MKKLFFIIFVSVVSLFAITILILSVLGQKERVGFIEFLDSETMQDTTLDYRIRIRYYSDMFRNSDIYGVYPKNDNLPSYVANIKWDDYGSPFGILTSKQEITDFSNIENVSYTLSIKQCVWLCFLLFV